MPKAYANLRGIGCLCAAFGGWFLNRLRSVCKQTDLLSHIDIIDIRYQTCHFFQDVDRWAPADWGYRCPCLRDGDGSHRGSHDHPPTNTLPSVRVGRFLSAKDLGTVRLVYGNFGEPTIATLVDAHIKNRTKFLSGHNSEYARSKSLYLTVTRPLNSWEI